MPLHDREFYWSGGAASLAAGFFYVGNVVNAADLAMRFNQAAAEPVYRELEWLLIPESMP